MYRIFEDRREAGRALIAPLRRCRLRSPLILGLPRGGIPVAYEIALALPADLDTIVVRKLGAPFQHELAIGAIASGGVRVLNEELLDGLSGVDEATLDGIVEQETRELERREKAYRGDRPYPVLTDRDVVLVDDGMATGASMRAAAEAVRTLKPARVIVAVPTASVSAIRSVRQLADEVVCLEVPPDFFAVGQFYQDFAQTTDGEVRDLLRKAFAREDG